MNAADAIAPAPPAQRNEPWLWRSTTLAGLTLAVPSLTYFGLNKLLAEGYESLSPHLAEFFAAAAALFLSMLTLKVFNDREKAGLDIKNIFSLKPYGRLAAVVAALLLADLFVSWTGVSLMDKFYPDTDGPEILQRLYTSHHNWFFIPVSTIIYACCEEIFFRGLVLNYAIKRAGFLKALLWTSFLFMFFHGSRNWISLAVIFVSGLIYGFAYKRTGGLAAPCLLHGLHNFIVRIIVVLEPDIWLF